MASISSNNINYIYNDGLVHCYDPLTTSTQARYNEV